MRELQQVTTTVPDAAKRCRFYRVEFLNGSKYQTRGGEECHQIAGIGAKMAGAARVAKWSSKSNAGGKYLLNKKAQNKQNRSKGWIWGITAKNGNTAKAGDFRLFAARGASFLWWQSFVLLLFVYQNVTNRKQ